MHEKPKLLIILQNFYGNRKGRLKRPVYNTRIINRKNATYSRLVKYLEPHFELWFTECTNQVANNKKTKFPTNLDFVKSACEHDNWFAIIAFSNQAHKAVDDLGIEVFAKLPHPVSWAWRKKLIEDCRDSLVEKLNEKKVN